MGAAFACGGGKGGGGSGVSGSKTIVQLDATEVRKLCEYLVDVAGPMRTVTCSDGSTVTVGGGTVDECVSSFQEDQLMHPMCMVTVAQFEDCIEDTSAFSDAQFCDPNTAIPPSCTPLLSAACSG
ncbi:MAG TPA: hypothetical protein VFQ53_41510 [Kofleriaceae bacterium]|nr:hypothetical protein [Kofleriaceae bacterium]